MKSALIAGLEAAKQSPEWKEGIFFFFFWWDWGWNFMFAKQVLYCLSDTSSPFCSGYFFGDGFSRTICPGWH
jgi:hypothetical protein